MRFFSYRNKQIMRRVILSLLLIVLLALVFLICRFIFVGRFITYRDGEAHLDYSHTLAPTGASPQKPDPAEFPFETVLDAAADSEDSHPDSTQLSGYYITTTMLKDQLSEVRSALHDLDDCNAVLIDVKSVFGNFYYSSELPGAMTADADIASIDALIEQLTAKKDLIVIARVPAFSDPNYAEAHQSQALALSSGALWLDARRCYWLNPRSADVQGYLSSIAIELSSLGFDAVLFDSFYCPDDESIRWPYDDVTRQGAVFEAAQDILYNLTGTDISVCFGTTEPDIAALASRVFLETDQPSQISRLTETLLPVLDDPQSQLVFLTMSRDTRFDSYGKLHPLLEID